MTADRMIPMAVLAVAALAGCNRKSDTPPTPKTAIAPVSATVAVVEPPVAPG